MSYVVTAYLCIVVMALTGSTALMMAAAVGNCNTMVTLLMHGANINAQNDKTDKGQKCTALHFAVLNKQTGAAKLLASLGAKTDIAMKDGKTVDDLIKAWEDEWPCTASADEEMKNAITEGKEKSRKGLPSPNWILDWLWILATKAVVVTTINPFQLLLFW